MNAGKIVVGEFQAEFLRRVHSRNLEDVDVLLSKLDAIQEQPQILDEYIQHFFDTILTLVVDKLLPESLTGFYADLYVVLYYFTKIRGAKVIISQTATK
ncbi:protein of unknown function [Taphrina deformans PYCC 5710]|uniref:Uncharacterized protein n=1 Tax=Taphrina deformans (strain PYCC 5710 / ATCC 11124 / CBS 356.35 / IMI 108563 / JCM 9778 / NBRC 8474) TaxID=1097556 RepID=R4XCD9_TAPDE|nr:protein of unknown function [Taphrina deformans PYCC 5710]|eukprot:CCG82036.1 protein of unknown function [Taphrina deformans PYCC 5710]